MSLETLAGMVHVGVFPGPIVGMLLDLQMEADGLPRISIDDYRFLTGPIVVHNRPGAYGLESHPLHRFKHLIIGERFDAVTGRSKLPVGPAELAMVMTNASLENPFDHYLGELYLWAGRRLIAQAQGQPISSVLSQMFGDIDFTQSTLSAFDDEFPLRPEMQMVYQPLADEIRRKVINANPMANKDRGRIPKPESAQAAE
jgi:hypothetical protein